MSGAYSVARLRRATLHFVGGRAVQVAARAGLVLLVVRLLPVADYGAYMLIVGIAEMLLQVCSFGILPTAQRFLPQLVEAATPRDTRRFLVVVTVLQLLLLALVSGLCVWGWAALLPHAGFSADQIERTRLAPLLFLLVPAFRFAAEMLEALLEQGKAQTARVLMPLGRIIGIAAVLGVGAPITLERVLLVDAAVTLGCVLLAWWLIVRCAGRLAEPDAPQPMQLRAMARHAWHMAAFDILKSTDGQGAVRIVLASTLGVVETGLFAFLQTLQRLVGRYLPSVVLRGLVRPMLISRARRKNGMEVVEQASALLTKVNLLIIAAAAVVISFDGDYIVALASGGKFVNAGDTLLLMVLALVFISHRQLVEMVMQVLNQTHVLRVTALLAPVTLLAVWLCAGHGLNAAVIALALGVGAANALNMWRLRAQTGRFAFDWWGTASIVATALVAALVGEVARTAFGPWVAIGVSGIGLLLLLMVAKPFVAGEMQLADRSFGRLGRWALQPFVRKAAA